MYELYQNRYGFMTFRPKSQIPHCIAQLSTEVRKPSQMFHGFVTWQGDCLTLS
jgi:hypothetical protein